MRHDRDKEIRIFPTLKVDVDFQTLSKKLKTSRDIPEINATAQNLLEKMQGKWESCALLKWFDFKLDQKTGDGRICDGSGGFVPLCLGASACFLEQAARVMVSVHTIGGRIDSEYADAVSKGNMLEAYIIDLIGLTALEKTTDMITGAAEEEAEKRGWGVGPFLSPGSVHGWNIEEQSRLCSLLPVEKINVTMKDNFVLSPVKTIAALIGIGPDYGAAKVGTTCAVCSKKDNCQMKLNT